MQQLLPGGLQLCPQLRSLALQARAPLGGARPAALQRAGRQPLRVRGRALRGAQLLLQRRQLPLPLLPLLRRGHRSWPQLVLLRRRCRCRRLQRGPGRLRRRQLLLQLLLRRSSQHSLGGQPRRVRGRGGLQLPLEPRRLGSARVHHSLQPAGGRVLGLRPGRVKLGQLAARLGSLGPRRLQRRLPRASLLPRRLQLRPQLAQLLLGSGRLLCRRCCCRCRRRRRWRLRNRLPSQRAL